MHPKVLLIGWDGADWKVASKLMDAGRMPHLKSFVDNGVMGNIATLTPVLSPMLWTSIATGKRAHKHGICGFAEPDPRTGSVRPITNLGRKTKALWNILNQNGKRCNVIGWWPSHPAEPINGVMVSNHFKDVTPLVRPKRDGEEPESPDAEATPTEGAGEPAGVDDLEGARWPLRPGAVHPPELTDRLRKFRMHPMEVAGEQLLPFVPAAPTIDQEKDFRLRGIARILAETTSIHAVATAVMQHEPWDFMAVYYDSIDHFSHGFMKFHPPREAWIDEADFDLYKGVVETAYVFHDLMLGATLRLAGDDTTVILMSDHGFHPDHLRPRMVGNEPAGPADEHRPFGILAMRGPNIRRNEVVFGAGLLDITPTVLSMFDLPVGRDMDGRPLLGAFERPPEVRHVDSWDDIEGDDGRHPPDTQVDAVDAHEAMKQLVELGYVEEPDEDKRTATTNTVRELRYNRARDLADARHVTEAIDEFHALWDEFPDESRFGVKLLNAQLQLGRAADARETLERLVREKRRYAGEAADELEALKKELEERDGDELKPQEVRKLKTLQRRATMNPAALNYLRGCVLCAEGDHEGALEVLERAIDVQSYNLPSLRQKMADCYAGLGRWEDARAQLEQVLEADPINAHAHAGLARCHLGEGRPAKALAEATSAIGLVYHNPAAHYLCASANARLGRLQDATDHLLVAIEQNPVFPAAHRLLARILHKRGRREAAQEHEALADAAQARIDGHQAGAPLPDDADVELDVAMDRPPTVPTLGRLTWIEDVDAGSVVVVSGLPRSGTSMMMQMLRAGGLDVLADEHRPADESNPRGYLEFEPARRLGTDSAWLEDARGKAVKIVAQLLPNLPQGPRFRVIFMQRPLGEVVASQTRMLDRLGRDAARISGRQLGETYRRQVDQVVKVLASHDEVALLPVDYHRALSDPEAISEAINEFLGGSLDTKRMADAVRPELRREGAESQAEPGGQNDHDSE